MSMTDRYEVTFHYANDRTHTLREHLTLDQIAGIRRALDERLHPLPPGDPDELPLVDGQPVRPHTSATFRFDYGDRGLVVPAAQIAAIEWAKVSPTPTDLP